MSGSDHDKPAAGSEVEPEAGGKVSPAAVVAGLMAGGESDNPQDGLMFNWSANRGGKAFALMFFTAVAILAHAAGFYLFQLAPPITGGADARSSRVTMLDPKHPPTAAVLREVDDRLFFLRPASLDSEIRLNIEDYAVTFQPSFMQHRVPFREPGAGKTLQPQPFVELVPEGGLFFPEIRATRQSEKVAGEGSVDGNAPRWAIGGDLAVRSLTPESKQRLREELAAPGAEPSPQFEVMVNESGRVIHVLSAGRGTSLHEEVGIVLRAMLRFEPAPGTAVQGGSFTLLR